MSERLIELDKPEANSLRGGVLAARNDVLDYPLVLRRYASQIIALTVIAIASTAFVTSFLVTKTYRAAAILRPTNPSSKMGGVVGDIASMYSQMGSLVVQSTD